MENVKRSERGEKKRKGEQKSKATMDEAFDPLKCNEELPSSPGCTMDFGKKTLTHLTKYGLLMMNYHPAPATIYHNVCE